MGDMPLMEAGLDSLAAVEYQSILTKSFEGVNLPATIMFDMPTTKMISEYIAGDLKEKLTVTEMITEGGDDAEEEDEDEDEDDSSEDEKPRKKKKKKQKAKKPKTGGGGGGGVMGEVYKGPSAED